MTSTVSRNKVSPRTRANARSFTKPPKALWGAAERVAGVARAAGQKSCKATVVPIASSVGHPTLGRRINEVPFEMRLSYGFFAAVATLTSPHDPPAA